MGCCSSTDSNDCGSSCGSGGCGSAGSEVENIAVGQQAERLASLMVETVEYQDFVRLANEVNSLPEVQGILMKMQRLSGAYASYDQEDALQALREELEALPAVQTYRAAEKAVRDLLRAVDEAVSVAAGVEFAVNAVRSGCG